MQYALKKLRRMRVYDKATGAHKVTLNQFKSGQFTGSNDTVYAEGADGAKLAAFETSKVAGFNGANGAIDSGYIAMQVGSEVVEVTDGTEIQLRAELKTDNGTDVTLPHKATGDKGNEIGFIYSIDTNGQPAKSYTQGAVASATEFAYDPETKKITLPTGVFKAGDGVVVDYYPKFSKYQRIDNDANKFSMTGRVVIDAWFTDLCSQEDVPLMVVLDSGKISGELDLSMGDQAAVQNVAVEAMASACYGASQNLWKMYTYDEEEIVD
mgnify:CR=1 FL=1